LPPRNLNRVHAHGSFNHNGRKIAVARYRPENSLVSTACVDDHDRIVAGTLGYHMAIRDDQCSAAVNVYDCAAADTVCPVCLSHDNPNRLLLPRGGPG
jgi:hypothetical protein